MNKIVIILMMFCLINQISAHAFTEAEAVRAVLGEARGESFSGKLAVSEALRRRGTLSGVYGAKVSPTLLARESLRTRMDALKAWRQSKTSNLVPGCRYWFSEADLHKLNSRSPRWFKRLRFVRKVCNHSFYA